MPLAMTFAVSLACAVGLARFGEAMQVRITSPAASPVAMLRVGVPTTVQGIVDNGDSEYLEVQLVFVDLVDWYANGRIYTYASGRAKHDPATGRFSGTVTPPPSAAGRRIRVSAHVVDATAHEIRVPRDREVVVTIK